MAFCILRLCFACQRQVRRAVVSRLVIYYVGNISLQIGLCIVLFVALHELAFLPASTLINYPMLVAHARWEEDSKTRAGKQEKEEKFRLRTIETFEWFGSI